MKYRRFGKTELQIPVISCGGMRYQQSWKTGDPVSEDNQKNLEATIHRSIELGINHIETARGYGTSEEQLGLVLPKLPRDEIIVQTKVAPFEDPAKFQKVFDQSMSLLKLDYVDLFAFHGINNDELIEHYLRCLPTAQKWREEGRIRHIGFSTHGPTDVLVKAIETGGFDYINLHWYYIFQDNWPAIQAATARDMGVFIISPNDKGGMLYNPTDKLCELTAPLHPMVFNGLFCLNHPEVHTLSCGVSCPTDFDIHMETVELIDRADEVLPPILERLDRHLNESLGADWAATWQQGLPEWHDTPGEVNIPVVLRLRNLIKAFDMIDYGKMRYNLLGKGDHWFPGNQCDKLDGADLSDCLRQSPHKDVIPDYLEETHTMLKGKQRARLQES